MSKKTIDKLLKLVQLDMFFKDERFSVYVNDSCILQCKHTLNSIYISCNQKNDEIKQVQLVTHNEDYIIPYENNLIHGFVKKTTYNGLVTECKYENNEKIDDFINLYWIINYIKH